MSSLLMLVISFCNNCIFVNNITSGLYRDKRHDAAFSIHLGSLPGDKTLTMKKKKLIVELMRLIQVFAGLK